MLGKMGGNFLLLGWITVEGPQAQGVYRGSPSVTKGSGGFIPLLGSLAGSIHASVPFGFFSSFLTCSFFMGGYLLLPCSC